MVTTLAFNELKVEFSIECVFLSKSRIVAEAWFIVEEEANFFFNNIKRRYFRQSRK